jgi:hypothetical protein
MRLGYARVSTGAMLDVIEFLWSSLALFVAAARDRILEADSLVISRPRQLQWRP